MDILFKSLLGGTMIGLVLLSARFFGPHIAGIMTGLPIIFLSSFLLGFIHKDHLVIHNYLVNISVSASLTAVFIILLTILHNSFPQKLALVFMVSLICYIASVILYLKFN